MCMRARACTPRPPVKKINIVIVILTEEQPLKAAVGKFANAESG